MLRNVFGKSQVPVVSALTMKWGGVAAIYL